MTSVLTPARLTSVLLGGLIAVAQAPPSRAEALSAEEAQAIAQEAYIYLYPLITMDITRKQLTNMEPSAEGIGGPVNTFNNIRTFPTADMRVVVRPNFDTLYSSGWLDLTAGPVIVSTADTDGRYFLLPMLDMWTDVFAVPGKRTSGTDAGHFAVVPPGWTGELPEGVERIQATTPYVWVIGRTQTNGPKDYAAVNKIQDGYKITPLADWGKEARAIKDKIDPAVDVKTPPLDQVNNMPAVDYFRYGAELMKLHPPHATDWSTIERMKRIGIEPGKFEPGNDAAPRAALEQGASDGLKLMKEKTPTIAPVIHGWQMNTNTMGVYGNYYLKRAIIAMAGLGANQVEDAVYPINISDAAGAPLTGQNKYVLHFNKDELPPAEAFWSVTMYDAQGFQVANPLNRFAIGDRDALKFNEDGSLDIFIQHENPGAEKESNWLPSPQSGELGVTMRLYAPRPQVLNGTWVPPSVKKVECNSPAYRHRGRDLPDGRATSRPM